VQRIFFVLGPDGGSHSDGATFYTARLGIRQVFRPGDETWEDLRYNDVEKVRVRKANATLM